ncbi:hypothetical protein [Candidatus Formimonas warabiya]|uniref:Uncharacterized protein n=1 Tax=Formimonas warabiya TaxID=1761012 RepID=A0A3G1KNB4_FORW1|nr:hypothetical protein [Candidatus Formimonas warabiya]ATW23916.1 hypothetical protein DCMF_03090 [Candidatus Formimonas warabiya]
MTTKLPDMPELLTPEVMEEIIKNAEAVKIIINSGEEEMNIHKNCNMACCCPKLLKFKFIFCNVYIINQNAKCSSEPEIGKN